MVTILIIIGLIALGFIAWLIYGFWVWAKVIVQKLD